MPSILDGGDAFNTSFMGKIVNVVSTHLTTGQSQSLTAQTLTRINNLSASITPKSVDSKILILAQWMGELGTTSPHDCMFGLQRDTTDLGLPTNPGNRNANIAPISIGYSANNASTPESTQFIYLDSPSTTSAIVYYMTIETYAGMTLYTCRTTTDADTAGYERGASTITLLEIL